jgi:hypothetical protein
MNRITIPYKEALLTFSLRCILAAGNMVQTEANSEGSKWIWVEVTR